jgi:glycosyltransferase involved in cell wall biosynthesis
MKILTIGASPYLLVRDGKINADIINLLKEQGHTVGSSVWHHDQGYFLPEDDGISYFQDSQGNIVCELYPLSTDKKETELYDLMKKFHPEIVISIGDYKDVDFVYSIKAMYPNLFKWIAVYPVECLWLNENYKERLEYADYSVCLSEFGWTNFSNVCNINGEFLSYGPNLDKFEFLSKIEKNTANFIVSAHNSQSSNLGAFIKSISSANEILSLCDEKVIANIHTNIHDSGDCDLELMIRRYHAKNVSLPDYYCSIKEGLPDDLYADFLRKGDFYIETSVKSATGLSMLESMAVGCIPIGMNVGRVGEIISMMPEEFQFFVEYETFIGSLEEEYSIISIKGLTDKILEVKKDLFDNKEKLKEASLAARRVSEKLSNKIFLQNFLEVINKVVATESSITLETY